jgi:hypothetical protein
MKTTRTSFSRSGLLLLWAALATLTAFSLLAIVPSSIPIQAPVMSFADFVSRADWRGLLLDGESAVAALVLLVVVALSVLYSMTRSAALRLSLVFVILIGPALAFSDRASEFALWFVRMPYVAITGTAHALLGQGNGQFYGDGPFTLTAIGWWTLFALILLSREILVTLRTLRSAEPSAVPNGGSATSLGNSRAAQGPPSVS